MNFQTKHIINIYRSNHANRPHTNNSIRLNPCRSFVVVSIHFQLVSKLEIMWCAAKVLLLLTGILNVCNVYIFYFFFCFHVDHNMCCFFFIRSLFVFVFLIFMLSAQFIRLHTMKNRRFVFVIIHSINKLYARDTISFMNFCFFHFQCLFCALIVASTWQINNNCFSHFFFSISAHKQLMEY